jgi:glycerophosphoryl diester phosphodiesterase
MKTRYLLLFLGLAFFGENQLLAQDKIVIAHRGASAYLPEHTLEAKVLAFAQGADYLEQDVVMTRDDKLVVLHDLTLERMTNVAEQFPQRARDDGSYYVIDFTLDELRQLRVGEGSNYPARFPKATGNFRIHTFEEELQLIQGMSTSTGKSVGIYPELKAPWFHHQHGKDIGTAVLRLLKQYGYDSREAPVYLQSFDHAELLRVRQELMPALGMELLLVQLVARNDWQETFQLQPDGSWQPYDYAWMLTPEGIASLSMVADGVGPAFDMLLENPVLIAAAQAAGMQVHPYTLRADDPRMRVWPGGFDALVYQLLYGLGVDGLFTDHPDRVIRVREAHAQSLGNE